MTTRPLVILGTGRIARALIQQLLDRAEHLQSRYNLALPVAVIANSRFIDAGEPYLAVKRLAGIAAHGLQDGDTHGDRDMAFGELFGSVKTRGERAIILDLTASDDTVPTLLAALDAGFDVVLANKKPLCQSYETFLRLTCHAEGHIGYEATVGAGLPVISPLHRLFDAGDELIDITACLSGTLGYLCTELEDGQPLSQIVLQAREQGYTEPDPRDDLSGADVRRKALILARTMNKPLELDDIPGSPLIALEEGTVDEWLASLSRYDATLAARVRSAQEQGNVLRYVARILPDRCEVGLREVPRMSAVGRLRGSDNIVTIHTRFYDERPLIVSGPGAGPEVTAAGVFGDVLGLVGIA